MNTHTNITKSQRNEFLSHFHHRDSCSELDMAANIVEELLNRFPAPECYEQGQAVDRAREFLDTVYSRGEATRRFIPYQNR